MVSSDTLSVRGQLAVGKRTILLRQQRARLHRQEARTKMTDRSALVKFRESCSWQMHMQVGRTPFGALLVAHALHSDVSEVPALPSWHPTSTLLDLPQRVGQRFLNTKIRNTKTLKVNTKAFV